MLSSLWLAFGLLGCASATGSSVIWEQRERSAIVKLDTPGYPLTTLRKHSSPPTRYKKAEKYYEEVPGVPSALLLNITMGHDNKTLFINQEMVFPFQDYNRPPRIGAYQIRADMSRGGILHMKKLGLLNREQECVTLDYRYLELDYDRLVRGDPEQGPWINASPELTFRVMGIGAHSRNTILDDSQQEILHIRLIDANHGMSDSPHRSFFLANIKFLRPDDQYFFDIPVVELAAEKKECTWTSWRCPDFRLYEDGAPYYRYIWRERFDKYGRVGSGRWLLVKKLWVLIGLWDGAGAAMVMSFGILMSIAMAVLGGIRFARYWAVCKERKRAVDETRRADEEERLIEAIVNEVEDGEEKLEQPDRDKPLPPLPQNELKEEVVADLIDLGSDDEGRM